MVVILTIDTMTDTKTILLNRIKNMTTEEKDKALFAYMLRDASPEPLCTIEVVRNNIGRGVRGRYDVVIVDSDGNRHVVDFKERSAKIFYVLLLMAKNGISRSSVRQDHLDNYYNVGCVLYNNFDIAKLESKSDETFQQFFNNAISKTRTAIKSALRGIDKPEHYLIADPKSHSSMLFIPLVKEYDGKVTFCAEFVRETETSL